MYAKIIRRQAKPGSLKTISDLSRKGGIPNIEAAPGFVAYYVVDLGGDEWATIARENAKVSTPLWKLGAEVSTRLIYQGYVLAMCNLHVLFGDEFRLFAEQAAFQPFHQLVR